MDIFDRLIREVPHPDFVESNLHYLVRGGSFAYGADMGELSDYDLYGFVIPPLSILFPFSYGLVWGFDSPQNFEQFHANRVIDEIKVDATIYNIVKFFRLTGKCNPNMIDLLYVPPDCIIRMTPIGNRVRENRELFLSKICWHTFKGYAYSQLSKAKYKTIRQWVELASSVGIDVLNPPSAEEIRSADIDPTVKQKLIVIRKKMGSIASKRIKTVIEKGWDTKFGYHLVRLMLEVEQILRDGYIDLRKYSDLLVEIRNGKWSIEDAENFFREKEKELEELYKKSTLPYKPRWNDLRKLLIQTISMHYEKLPVIDYDEIIVKLFESIDNINQVISSLIFSQKGGVNNE